MARLVSWPHAPQTATLGAMFAIRTTATITRSRARLEPIGLRVQRVDRPVQTDAQA